MITIVYIVLAVFLIAGLFELFCVLVAGPMYLLELAQNALRRISKRN